MTDDTEQATVGRVFVRDLSNREQINDTYRAIGRYMVAFSLLERSMRWGLQSGLKNKLSRVVLGEMTAYPLRDAFFGSCRTVCDFDEVEQAVASRLRARVTEEIERRNFIAHAEWLVGYTEGDKPGMATPQRHRNKPMRAEGSHESVEETAEDLDKHSEALGQLTNYLHEFGQMCFGFHYLSVREGGPPRLRDIFIINGSLKKGTLVREGPRAHQIEIAVPDFGAT
jgi:hypothetical protein